MVFVVDPKHTAVLEHGSSVMSNCRGGVSCIGRWEGNWSVGKADNDGRGPQTGAEKPQGQTVKFRASQMQEFRACGEIFYGVAGKGHLTKGNDVGTLRGGSLNEAHDGVNI